MGVERKEGVFQRLEGGPCVPGGRRPGALCFSGPEPPLSASAVTLMRVFPGAT